jgi:hypothetical protein
MPNESPADGAPEPAGPFPPAFRWETSAQEAPTQVMGAVGRDTALRDPSLDERSENSTPPWAQLDPPPIAEQQSDWLRLGPEAFESDVPESRSRRTLGLAVLAVAVLGLAGAAVVYFLTGGSPNRTDNQQVTAPPVTSTAPSAQPVLPTIPAAAPPVTAVAPVTTPAGPPPAPAAAPEATGSPEPPPIAPAAPPPAGLPPSPPLHRSAGGNTQGRAAVPAPAPRTESRPTAEAPQPPPPPADTSAPDGFTRVPSKPWKPQPPQ